MNTTDAGAGWQRALGAARLDLLLWALAAVALLHAWEGTIDLLVTDEGYLWYGTWRTGLGEVPMVDFQGYMPGRYYWDVFWTRMLGGGVLDLRIANDLFQALGIYAALCLLHANRVHWLGMLLATLVLLCWMYPRQKLFEPSIALMAAWLLCAWVRQPGRVRSLLVFALPGWGVWMGLNHGLYLSLVVSLLALLLWRQGRLPYHSLRYVLPLGFALGLLPHAVLTVLHPAYPAALWDTVMQMLARTETNVPLPVPWPWTIGLSARTWLNSLFVWTKSFAFVGLVLMMLAALGMGVWAWYRKAAGAVFMQALVLLLLQSAYAHHAFARTDISHLAQAVAPGLLLLLCLPAWCAKRAVYWRWGGGVVCCVLLLGSSLAALSQHPGWHWQQAPKRFVPFKLAGETLRLPRAQAQQIQRMASLHARLSRYGSGLFVPYEPLYYRLFQQKSPLSWLCFLSSLAEPDRAALMQQWDAHPPAYVVAQPKSYGGVFPRFFPEIMQRLQQDYRLVDSRNGLPVHDLWIRRDVWRQLVSSDAE